MATITRRLIDSPPHRPLTLGQMLSRLGQAVGRLVQRSSTPLTEPEVRQRCDCHGNVYWHIYDRKTGQHVYCMSEVEVSLWMDRAVFRI